MLFMLVGLPAILPRRCVGSRRSGDKPPIQEPSYQRPVLDVCGSVQDLAARWKPPYTCSAINAGLLLG